VRFILLACWLPLAALAAPGYVAVPGGEFATSLRYEDLRGPAPVAPFAMMARPVTNAEFLAFVKHHPQWKRDGVAAIFAAPGYLAHWPGALELASREQAAQPVTQVSWFAAEAYCKALGARLPHWLEWEYAAAADRQSRDARGNRAWQERILEWYAQPTSAPLPAAGASAANFYGVRDLHGVIWEWTDDFLAMLVSSDNRAQGDPDRDQFCGAGALSVNDREQYAVLMRVALLSSLSGRDSTSRVGFRCVKEIP
jgi:formylglycine-generating enzyme required for sulfatase activity